MAEDEDDQGNCGCFGFAAASQPLLSPEQQAAANAQLTTAGKALDLAQISAALAAGADPNAFDAAFFNYTPLHLASGKGAAEVVELLLAKKAAVDPRSTTDETPLIMAART